MARYHRSIRHGARHALVRDHRPAAEAEEAIATTRCPRCGKPAVFVESRRIGEVETSAGRQEVVERHISCPPPAGCGASDAEVLVFWRVDLFQGATTKRTVTR